MESIRTRRASSSFSKKGKKRKTASSSGSETEKKGKRALSSSSSTSKWKYEVFLSFHGPDTRLSFTDHLYVALKQKGILTFRDDEKLERGKDISQELLKAIQESLYAIVILSPNYASSKWCLKELAEIVKCKTQTKLEILPIFYDVDPSDVRKQTGTFEKGFDKHAKDPETNFWRAALTEVGNIAGWDLRNGPQATYIQKIVADIFEKLSLRFSSVYCELVGIDSPVMEMMELLGMGLNDVRFIGIHGMGGVGKTTLSQVIYDRVSHQFEGSSFLASVRESSEKQGLVLLQKQLLCEILKERKLDVWNVSQGTKMIASRLRYRMVFVVLDDVDTREQLEALVGARDWFGPGSRIIFTSRDIHLLYSHGGKDIYLYELKGLNDVESLELFSLLAFKKPCPEEDYWDLSKYCVKYTRGLPLALKVLGSFLFGRTKEQWKSAWDQLKVHPNREIMNVLQISFDRLEDAQKNLFLDIACFFKGEFLDSILDILESFDYFPNINIDVLVKKSLITISTGMLCMHDLLQKMGQEIVRRESPKEPGGRSRLWRDEDVLHVLKHKTGTSMVEGMVLNLPTQKKESLHVEVFSKMKKLRILCIGNKSIIKSPKFCPTLPGIVWLGDASELMLPNDLCLLEWYGYPFKSLAPGFRPNNLIELSMPCSHIEQLCSNDPIECFGSLKLLDLRACKSLIKTPDFTEIPNLEFLDLSGCVSLSQVHQSIGVLKRLKELNLSHCASLESLPQEVLKSLEVLDLRACKSLIKTPDFTKIPNLEFLDLSGCASLSQVHQSIGVLKHLKELSLSHCASLESIPLEVLESLEVLDLRACKRLIKTPDFTKIPNLKFLDLSGCASLSQVHQSIGVLKWLKKLNLSRCVSLESVPLEVLESLEVLILSGCSSLIKTPDFTKIPNLVFLNLSDCVRLSQVHQSIGVLKRLEILNLSRCVSLKSIPLEVLESLKVLTLSGCSSLIKTPNFTKISNLKFLNLSGSTNLSQVHQSIGVLKRLRKLNLSHCVSLKSLPLDMTGLESLKILTLSACTEIEEFPNLSRLKCLSEFKANDTAITKLPSPSLLPKKFEMIEVSGHNDLPPKMGVSCFNGCGTLLEESSHPFRISCLWFYNSPTAHYHQYIWRIFYGSKEIVCERYFLQGLCINCDGEHGGDILYFGLGELLTGLTFIKRKNIFEFLMLGASLATSRIFEWFNNTTATCSSPTLQDSLRCEEGSSARQLEVINIIDFTTPVDHPKLKDNRELKGCSLFFVFEIHGPARDTENFHPEHYPPLLPFACIFERNEGNPTEPLFVWAPAVPGVGPIEFWAFVPATWFLEHPNNWDTCNSHIRASVVPPLMRFGSCYYYFSGKETKSEIPLEEWKDLGVDVKDCRVRLVYEDDASQFYSIVAPHGLHSKYYEQYPVDDPSYHPFKTDSDEEAEYLEQHYIDDPRPWETNSDEETDSDEEMEKMDSDEEMGEVSRLTSTVKFEWLIQRPPRTQASDHATTNWTASVLPFPIHLPSFPPQSPNR